MEEKRREREKGEKDSDLKLWTKKWRSSDLGKSFFVNEKVSPVSLLQQVVFRSEPRICLRSKQGCGESAYDSKFLIPFLLIISNSFCESLKTGKMRSQIRFIQPFTHAMPVVAVFGILVGSERILSSPEKGAGALSA